MAIGSVGTETFASEVVMVEIPGTEKLAAEIEEKKEVDKDNEKTPKREEVEIPVRYDDRIRIRNYSRSRSPRRRALPPVISNTASLDSILNESDTCIETIKGQLLYITTHAFHTAELQKVSWLFQQGILDSWVQKPGAHLPTQFDLPRMDTRRGRSNCYIDDDYVDEPYYNNFRRGQVPSVRLGSALSILRKIRIRRLRKSNS